MTDLATPPLRGTDMLDAPPVDASDGAGVVALAAAEAVAPTWLGITVPDLAWKRRWELVIAAWGVAAVAVYLTAGANLDPYLSLTGLFVGFLVGLTGMGGGALMTPILIIFFGFQPTMAVGTDVTYAGVTKIIGSWRHWRRGSVDWPLALWLAAGSVPASLLGVAAVNYVKHHYGDLIDSILYRAIGSALLAVGLLLVVRVLMRIGKEHRRENIAMSTRRKVLTIALGASAGFVIGLTSVGSGTFLGVILILFYPLTTDRIVGTDVFHAMILLLATGLAQISAGNVNLWMVAALLIGSIPGVVIGSHLTVRAPTRVLRLCLAAVLFASGLALLQKA
jgi:hypothetical protein